LECTIYIMIGGKNYHVESLLLEITPLCKQNRGHTYINMILNFYRTQEVRRDPKVQR